MFTIKASVTADGVRISMVFWLLAVTAPRPECSSLMEANPGLLELAVDEL